MGAWLWLPTCKGRRAGLLVLAAEHAKEQCIDWGDGSSASGRLPESGTSLGKIRHGLSVLSTTLDAALSGRRFRRLRTGRCWGENQQPQDEYRACRPAPNAHGSPSDATSQDPVART